MLNLPTGYNGPLIDNLANSVDAGQVAGSARTSFAGPIHAVMWNGTGTAIDLNPTNLAGFATSTAVATDGIHQVGAGDFASGGEHALVWNGTSDSAIDIQPTNLPGIDGSSASGIAGNQIVGNAGDVHPLLWNSIGTTAVDLFPSRLTGFNTARTLGTDGHHQVGYGLFENSALHGLLWSGTAESAVDLSPGNLPGYTLTEAIGVRDDQVVGGGNGPATGSQDHALLWKISTGSATDFNPANFLHSLAEGTNGAQQVGFGAIGGETHALLWNGTAASAVDLNGLLPAGFNTSLAFSIDSDGNIFGIADDAAGNMHAVEWVVPEPSLLWVVSASLLAMRRLRTRNRAPSTPVRDQWCRRA